MNRQVLLSFDVEEFDMPLEYQFNIPVDEQMRIGIEGLNAIMPILETVPSTLFTTANFANHYPERISKLALSHEIASHTFYHTAYETADLLKSRLRLEEISGQKITGLRMPRMHPVLMEDVKAAGYTYDSSINPTWLPGRYNNFHLPRTVYTENGIKRIPASVSPGIRIPLFWLSFKNMPYALYLKLCRQTIAKDGYICLYFHPWEFTPIEQFGLPGYTRRWCGPILVERLLQLVKDLSKDADFETMNQL
ncbi:polysaccharide deacetylase family protein [Sediminibacterium sp.]|uniref:polysaccharide deacetylase family protein n=1 Tax=Sediminibacterium sp. TaxID=1917865 RepID=UPI002721FA4E|nr:polysaccharide deacetylase family protein [Sediminibacterium sp.]MDO8995614.1 polysaccharide deacetylase family protein [Sediminibacterium sp.]MDO9156997.1 polysaccharide deacetylase family protein [Sediminibacterium sp.]MDP2421787.1 polysaccharide deacetylase family protein [Sediminibacterium sp.]